MTNTHHKYIIIGGGLSGLTMGYELSDKGISDFIVLEARDRIGGRIKTDQGVDLGATWFQDHHSSLKSLIETLELPIFRQFSSGKGIFLYSSMAPAQYFESDPNAPSGYRIGGGSQALIKGLAERFKGEVVLKTQVERITSDSDQLNVFTNKGQFSAEQVIVALPLQLSANLEYEPHLSPNVVNAMNTTHTWMSNAIKVGINYKKPFWRSKGFSGTLIGHVSPVIEMYDHSNIEDTKFSLMGFINEGLRDETLDTRKERIIDYLSKHLGSEARNYTRYQEKDWSDDHRTSSKSLKSVYISPNYGNPLFQQSFMNKRVHFIGAETALQHGGYMDGAVRSAKNLIQRILP